MHVYSAKTKLWAIVGQSSPRTASMTLNNGLPPHYRRDVCTDASLALNNYHHDNSFALSSMPTSNCRPRSSTPSTEYSRSVAMRRRLSRFHATQPPHVQAPR